jgi:hypothetical protein
MLRYFIEKCNGRHETLPGKSGCLIIIVEVATSRPLPITIAGFLSRHPPQRPDGIRHDWMPNKFTTRNHGTTSALTC